LQSASPSSGSVTATPEIWNKALVSARDKLYSYTRARPPSRTLVDPLAAFIENLDGGYEKAVNAAAAAAEKTKDIEAKAGRSAYVDSALLTKERVADPGAWGVREILLAMFNITQT
jgi:triose/dihydroxyacetone kinase / FAD-AMP lyase (cyclizing)